MIVLKLKGGPRRPETVLFQVTLRHNAFTDWLFKKLAQILVFGFKAV